MPKSHAFLSATSAVGRSASTKRPDELAPEVSRASGFRDAAGQLGTVGVGQFAPLWDVGRADHADNFAGTPPGKLDCLDFDCAENCRRLQRSHVSANRSGYWPVTGDRTGPGHQSPLPSVRVRSARWSEHRWRVGREADQHAANGQRPTRALAIPGSRGWRVGGMVEH
jgi:hypothetical protein